MPLLPLRPSILLLTSGHGCSSTADIQYSQGRCRLPLLQCRFLCRMAREATPATAKAPSGSSTVRANSCCGRRAAEVAPAVVAPSVPLMCRASCGMILAAQEGSRRGGVAWWIHLQTAKNSSE